LKLYLADCFVIENSLNSFTHTVFVEFSIADKLRSFGSQLEDRYCTNGNFVSSPTEVSHDGSGEASNCNADCGQEVCCVKKEFQASARLDNSWRKRLTSAKDTCRLGGLARSSSRLGIRSTIRRPSSTRYLTLEDGSSPACFRSCLGGKSSPFVPTRPSGNAIHAR
jgi:hypothetical protein